MGRMLDSHARPEVKVVDVEAYYLVADAHDERVVELEEAQLHALVRPRFFIPAHGEYRMLSQHADLAVALGMKREDVFILANGDIFEIARGKARISGFTNGAAVLIDGTTSIDDADNTVLRLHQIDAGNMAIDARRRRDALAFGQIALAGVEKLLREHAVRNDALLAIVVFPSVCDATPIA